MPFLLQIDAYDPVADAIVALRASSVDEPECCHLDNQLWWPVIDRLPTLGLDFFGGEFGRVSTPAGSLSLNVEPWANFGRYSLPDARLRLWHGEEGAAWGGYTLRFDGRVTAMSMGETGVAEIGFAVDDKWLDQPFLATYAGTGGIEGRVEQKGVVKPLALGAPLGVPGILIDPVRSIIQLSGYGSVQGVDVPLERLARQFGSPVADYANYAALEAATVAAGTWVTAHAIGCVRMGAPPYGKLCFLMRGDNGGTGGWVRRAGAIIKRLAELAGGLSKTDGASMAALDSARPYDLSVYIESQTGARGPIQSIAASVNAVAGVSLTGQLFAIPVQINAVGLTLNADGSGLPIVSEVKRLGISAPWWRQAIGAQPFWDVHGQGDYVALDSFLEAIGGVSTARHPLPAPTDWPVGSIYFDANNVAHRFEGVELLGPDGLPIIGTDGLPLTGPGYVRVRDKGIGEVIAALQSIDDDGILTIDEKIRVAIPESARLEAMYQGLLANASSVGIAVTALTAARTSWLALRDAIVPAWNDSSQPSPIVRVDWDTVLDLYRQELEAARVAIATPSAVSIVPPTNQKVRVDSDGIIEAGEYPRVLTPVVKRGATDIRTANSTSYSIATSGISATVNNINGSADKGKITATDGSAGYIDLTVTADGVSFGPYRILFEADDVPIWSGTDASGVTELGNGLMLSWREIAVAGNAAGVFFDYGNSHDYTTFAHAWLSGGIGGANAQDNNPYIDFGAGGDTLTGAYISSARDTSCTCKLFALGI